MKIMDGLDRAKIIGQELQLMKKMEYRPWFFARIL
jgi:hypothetical protein